MGNDVSAMDVLKNTPFAKFLSAEVVRDVSLCFTSVKFKPGATIAFAKHEFLIVAKGSADVSTIVPHAQKKIKVMELLCNKKEGDILTNCTIRGGGYGRTGLMRKSSLDKGSGGKNLVAMLDLVTVTADKVQGCVLLRLDRDKFVKVRAHHMMHRSTPSQVLSINKAQRTAEDDWHLISTIADDQIVDYLAAVPFFSEVKPSRLVALAGLCTFLVARKSLHSSKEKRLDSWHLLVDDMVCREGELGDRFFICITGVLAVSVTNQTAPAHQVSHRSMSVVAQTMNSSPSTRRLETHRSSVRVSQVLIRRLADGSYFGEISLILNMRRSATVTAIEDSLLVYIDARAFRNFLKVCPDVKVHIQHVVVSRLLQISSKAPSAQFLATLTTEDLLQLAQLGHVQEVAHGTKLVLHRDDPVFYIVLNGKVQVEYALPSGSLYVVMSTGGYFGELSILLQTQSLIQVTVRDDSVLLGLSPEAFHRFFSKRPDLFAEFSLKFLQHDATIDHVINHYDAHEVWLVYLEARHDNYEEKIRSLTHGVYFCEDVDEFHATCADMSIEDRLDQARTIVDTYLSHDSDRPVQIPKLLLQDIRAAIDAVCVEASVFDQVRREVIDQMDVKVFEEFKKSSKFATVLSKLVCVTELPSQLTPAMKAHLNFQVFKHRQSHEIINRYTWMGASPR
ncbi:unnamed protein product [Aphanomyces euteiches]